jgi:hypothetical protein
MQLAFVESHRFSEKIFEIASEDEYEALQTELGINPEKGDLIPGVGGARKIRMAIRGCKIHST